MRTKKSICPPTKFGFGKKCVTWVYVLTLFTLFTALIICIVVYLDKSKLGKINQTYRNRININRIDDDSHLDMRHHLANQELNNKDINIGSYHVKNLNSGQLRSLMDSHFDDKTVNKLMRYRYLNETRKPSYDNELELDKYQVETECNRKGSNDRDINININVPRVPNLNNESYPNYIHQKNHERVINPLLPPERSYENTYGIPINIPTRGSSGGFQQIGMLYKQEITNSSATIGNNSDTAVFPLYGKPIYPGSNKWSYYTASDKFNSVKMPISHNGRRCDSDYGCQELYSGDIIQIPAYNGNFKVDIYDYDKPRYIPYVN
jgi:hypothetical protein